MIGVLQADFPHKGPVTGNEAYAIASTEGGRQLPSSNPGGNDVGVNHSVIFLIDNLNGVAVRIFYI